MGVVRLEFPKWWEEFLRDGHQREDSSDALDRLLRYVRDLPSAKLEAFTSELVDLADRRDDGWHIALSALELVGSRVDRRRLLAVATQVPAVTPPHPLGDYRHALLRVLAKDPNDEFLAPVDAYCNSEIGLGFSSVVWALWPHHKDRFARYHARYFAEITPSTWSGTAVVQAFATAPEALASVRDKLSNQYQLTWNLVRSEVLAACSGSWVTEEQAREIRRVCSDGAA